MLLFDCRGIDGQAPGLYRVDLYVREIGEPLDATYRYSRSTKNATFGSFREKVCSAMHVLSIAFINCIPD